MATLQNIRSKGPLLVIVIGLALFAFIAGDAWKVLQPHQSQDVGEVNGETISAQDFQALVEEYTEVVKFSSGLNALSDEQTNQIKDEVWRAYVNNKLIENEAEKLGLTVSKAELQAIIDAGVHPMLQQTPFRNPQTGAFDKDMLKKFLVDYSKMNKAQMPAQYAEYYNSMYNFWSFVEKSLIQARLQEKYQALITKSLFSNPVEAEDAFNARVDQSDLLLAAVPYSSIVDSTIVIKESELKDAYNKKKSNSDNMWKPVTSSILMCRLLQVRKTKPIFRKKWRNILRSWLRILPIIQTSFAQPVLLSNMLTYSIQTRRCLLTLLPVWIL